MLALVEQPPLPAFCGYSWGCVKHWRTAFQKNQVSMNVIYILINMKYLHYYYLYCYLV